METKREPTGQFLPLDEVDKKLEYLERLERYWKDYFPSLTGEPRDRYKPFHQIVIATVMMMDINTLRELASVSLPRIQRQYIIRRFLQDLMVMPCFVKMVITKKSLKDEAREDSNKQKVVDDLITRVRVDRAILDNHRCIVLGTENPEICHIVPFSVNDDDKSRAQFEKYLVMAATCIYSEKPELAADPESTPEDTDAADMAGNLTDDDITVDSPSTDGGLDDAEIELARLELWATLCRKVSSSKTGVSDRSWNEISLNKQLHDWWSKGYFAFKPLGIDGKIVKGLGPKGDTARYTQVKLQFHWMPRRDDIASTATPLNKTYGDPEANGLNPVLSQDRESSVFHRVQTGDIFYVKVEHRYAERMLAAFRIKWAAINILSMAGGAESLDDVGDYPEYLDENLNWMGDVKRGTTVLDLMKEWDD
ncbi:hypothetical protein B0T19DRAFT_463706 [Cercophora scortea]|uniref:HNH nuclease domain-containing protein n=1 Tax=Cercophora scortea TaxID=314031 RepID=A0AAE0MAE1_9PEZI|nr:hypothetical protein B0T19DRAFT_463706 [Cercophora scortea]